MTGVLIFLGIWTAVAFCVAPLIARAFRGPSLNSLGGTPDSIAEGRARPVNAVDAGMSALPVAFKTSSSLVPTPGDEAARPEAAQRTAASGRVPKLP